jgi:hypothetical protein
MIRLFKSVQNIHMMTIRLLNLINPDIKATPQIRQRLTLTNEFR